jgi:hypothetical protein
MDNGETVSITHSRHERKYYENRCSASRCPLSGSCRKTELILNDCVGRGGVYSDIFETRGEYKPYISFQTTTNEDFSGIHAVDNFNKNECLSQALKDPVSLKFFRLFAESSESSFKIVIEGQSVLVQTFQKTKCKGKSSSKEFLFGIQERIRNRFWILFLKPKIQEFTLSK